MLKAPMADPIAVRCPECKKSMSVPATLAGKKIRCKGCEAPVSVPGGSKPAAKPTAKPAAKKKDAETFKLAEEPKPEAPKVKPRYDDLENDDVPYGMTEEGEYLPRCAFCAKELDPPDARICRNCGYDMQERRRHESKAVWEATTGDYIKHHAVTILAFFTILICIGLDIYCLMNMNEWFEGSVFENDEKDPTTGKPTYLVGPGIGKVWITIVLIFVCWYAGRFIYRMLAFNFRPTEAFLKE
jgi:hypothetical protein